MSDARLLYVSSAKRVRSLEQEFNLEAGVIREGDYLFRFANLERDVAEELAQIHLENKSYIKLLSRAADGLVIKVIPEPDLFNNLEQSDLRSRLAAEFVNKIKDYFLNHQKWKWDLGERSIDFNDAPLVMGILNVTPDSFSDGGRFFDKNKAVDRALEMIEEGADIIDVGGESTRPGAEKVSADEELRRVLPVIEQIRKQSNILISIDTYKSLVAAAALQSGADIINDISGMTFNEDMLAVIEKERCPYIVMHIQGTPQNMQMKPAYPDVLNDVYTFLLKKCEVISAYNDGRVIIDPGFGFGKSIDHNLLLLRDLVDFSFIGKPILVGVSRKSFIGKVLDRDVDRRFVGTIVSEFYASLRKADILRVHDVRETIQAKKMLNHIIAA